MGGASSTSKGNKAPKDERVSSKESTNTKSSAASEAVSKPQAQAFCSTLNLAPKESSFQIVILGAGGVGKSTIVKQLAMSMGDGIDNEQRLEAAVMLRVCIINKTIHTTERALEGIEGIPELSSEVLDNVDVVQLCDPKKLCGKELEQVGEALKNIWADDAVKAVDRIPLKQGALSLSDELVHECADHFLRAGGVERVFTDTYIPSDSELVTIRMPTTNITFTNVKYNGEVFVIKDVGGQIQHQDMWTSAFKNVRAVLYVASLDDYHRNDSNGRNRLIESLELFKMVCGNPAMAGLPFVIIFNKQDLFREKIKICPLSTCSAFKKGGKADTKEANETDSAYADRCMQYISKLFEVNFRKTVKNEDQQCSSYCTCATDSELVKQVMSNVFKTMYIMLEKRIGSFAF